MRNSDIQARMRYATSRVNFIHVGNNHDSLAVKLDESYIAREWPDYPSGYVFDADCTEGDNHSCSMRDELALAFIESVGTPPLWQNPSDRPSACPFSGECPPAAEDTQVDATVSDWRHDGVLESGRHRFSFVLANTGATSWTFGFEV